jgi:hypothetical protein
MPFMRFYRINPDGRISTPAEEIECVDDAEALALADAMLVQVPGDGTIEIWDRARCVGKVSAAPPGDSTECASLPKCAECTPDQRITA